MKKILSLITLIGCMNPEIAPPITGVLFQEFYEYHSCMDRSIPNPAYMLPQKYSYFKLDSKQYNNVIIGDSTMDFSSSYPGFLSPWTQSTAVAGNKMCDIITQLAAINTEDPENIILSTPGGNDLLVGNSRKHVKNLIRDLVIRLNKKFPGAKITVVGIHPTLADQINSEKKYINDYVILQLENIHGCYVDPLLVFQVREGERAPGVLMFDQIHYTREVSFLIKEAIRIRCGVVL